MLDQVVSNDDLRSLQAVGPWFNYAVNQKRQLLKMAKLKKIDSVFT